MSDANNPKQRARRQVKQHVDLLHSAGVEFVAIPPDRPMEPIAAEPTQGAATVDTSDTRRKALGVLAEEVAKCDRCPELYSTRTQTVFGTGPLSADLCFVGEAPGADEDRQGVPFIGAAGQLLTKIIMAMELTRDEAYICNTLKCRPPNNATPTPQQCTNCRPFFERQLDLVQPKFICCLGGVAAQNVLNTKVGITKLRGQFYEYRGIPVLCTFHPSYLLRDPSKKKDVWEDMKTLLTRMGRPIPAGK